MRQGERGPTGDHGQHGDTGERGLRGERGTPGSIPPKIMRAFVTVIVVAFVVLLVQGYTIRQNRQAISRIDHQAITLGELQTAQNDSCDNYETLRKAVNEFHGTIAKFLSTALRAREESLQMAKTPAERRLNQRAVTIYKKLLANTHQVSATCAQKKHQQKEGS